MPSGLTYEELIQANFPFGTVVLDSNNDAWQLVDKDPYAEPTQEWQSAVDEGCAPEHWAPFRVIYQP